MTRTISLITGIVLAALAVGVAPALGEGRLAGSPEHGTSGADWFERAAAAAERTTVVVSRPDSHEVVSPTAAVGYLDAHQRATLPQSTVSRPRSEVSRSEALNRMYGLGESAGSTVVYKDAHERAALPQSTVSRPRSEVSRSEALNRMYALGEFAPGNRYIDAHERAVLPTPASPVIATTTADDGVQWPQIGIGFGVGLVLILGLMLTLKATHTRPFAH